MKAFLQAFSMIFAAEVGDKSQLLVLAMATKYPLLPLVLGINLSIILSQLLATTLGFLLRGAIPINLINLLAGVLFIAIGFKTLFPKNKDCQKNDDTGCSKNPFWEIFSLYTLGELGDKTQITCIIIASQCGDFFGVLFGAIIAMMVANLLALGLGRFVSSQLSAKTIETISAVMYIGFGFFSLLAIV